MSDVIPMLTYDDPNVAYDWLQSAFGFEPTEEPYRDDRGVINHGELRLGGTVIAISGPYDVMRTASPRSVGGKNTAFLYVYVDDVDAHHARAAAAGAEVIAAPEDAFFGDRRYRVLDCEGRVWMFGTPIPT